MDEMALKEHIQFDGKNLYGGTDFGDIGVLGASPEDPQLAKDALGIIFY